MITECGKFGVRSPMESGVARILDANFNRAREAMRVIEESVRFGADDASLTAAMKQLRHDLAAAMAKLDAEGLLAGRDTPGDVGTTISTDAERTRDSTADVVAASFKRLTEALRVLEEYGKTVNAAFAAVIEQLRYRVYDLEVRVRFEPWRLRRFAGVRLYVLITESLCRDNWLAAAEAAIEGGAQCLQLREKAMPDGELLRRAEALRELTRRRDVLLVINDRPDIARLVGADGVHLGQDDMPVAAARRIAGQRALIGKSTHTLDQARNALAENPDYIAVGPMFATATKPQEHVAGPETLAAVLAEADRPLVAIGGITPDRIGALTAVGCRCVAVCTAVISQPDVTAAARAIRAIIDR
jgi:thiamine-phosphate pyrophosphorylase